MATWILFILLFGPAGYAEEPFWRSKEKIYQRIAEEREIIVSVTSQKMTDGKTHQMRMIGGGHIEVPRDYAFRRAMDFAALGKMSDYVKSTHYDEATRRLTLALEAFGHRARFEIQVATSENAGSRFLDFTVVGGDLKDLKGRLEFRQVRDRRAEVGFVSNYEYVTLPIPTMFVEFGLEFIIKRMAFSIRRAVEGDWRNGGHKE